MSSNDLEQTSYADAGVSIDRGNRLIERIKPLVKGTERSGVMGNLGGFGALFDMTSLNYRHPVLVSGSDGVGTKIMLAIEAERYNAIGVDLVAMCVNDLLVQGAEPLFFLDYYASSTLDIEVAEQVVAGIVRGCTLAGCALVGGETAEMPGLYRAGDFDVAGFCVGVVEKDEIIDGRETGIGDALIGIASSGPHANGFSLIRKLLSDSGTKLTDKFQSESFADVLLEPTKIYIKPVRSLLKEIPVKAIAHVTGGGLPENLPRVLPTGVQANIDCSSWRWPPIFNWLMETGNIELEEMYRTFNCGVGMVLIVQRDTAAGTIDLLQEQGETAWLIGEVSECPENKGQVRLKHTNAG
ncbi:MAG: phosphoribosylformylglycinamidine cyclo-ligase [Gammaproteobacteria bacterium]